MTRLLPLLVLALAAGGAARAQDTLDPVLGKALFERIWISAPASTDAADGLGPLFNARSCAACHPRGGAGRIGIDEDGRISGPGLVVRFGSQSGHDDPTYGRQLQTDAVQGQKAEGAAAVVFESLDDGRREPDFRIENKAFGALAPDTRIGARRAPPLHGAGLLDAVPDAAILAHADPEDEDGDGISGRPNWVTLADGTRALGRFGWKAREPSLNSQIASAFHLDIGLSSQLHPDPSGDCTAAQDACHAAPNGASPRFDNAEVSAEMLRLVGTYVRALSPPRPAAGDPEGARLFAETGCAACHVPALSGPDGRVVPAFTDLLLHDMGAGLADGIREAGASGHEWRTAPLWGLGASIEAGIPLLHDGRARTVTEAILWHDGEAAGSRNNFKALASDDRDRLLAFLAAL